MSQVINGYSIANDFSTDNAGMSRWSTGVKGGRTFFIKEFLAPKYPDAKAESVLSPETIRAKREECARFEKDRKEFYRLLKESNTGAIVYSEDFFRFGSKYYSATEYISPTGTIPMEQLCHRTPAEKEILLRVLAQGMASVHKNGLIHGDLKPDNILFKRTMAGLTAKIIDFDSGFMAASPPKSIVGDPAYNAPETRLWNNGGADKPTAKIDVFALGIIFHEIWCGKRPNHGAYDYIADAVWDGVRICADNALPGRIGDLIELMLSKEPERRPSAVGVFQILTGQPVIDPKPQPEPAPAPTPSPTPVPPDDMSIFKVVKSLKKYSDTDPDPQSIPDPTPGPYSKSPDDPR